MDAIEITHPTTDDLSSLDQMISDCLGYEGEGSFAGDFPRLLSADNCDNLYIIKKTIENGSKKEQIVSHAGVLPLEWQSAKGPGLKLIVIGGVATHADFRSKGFGSRILEKILEDWKNQADFAVLWTDQPEYFQKFGFQGAGTQALVLLPERIPKKFIKDDNHFDSDVVWPESEDVTLLENEEIPIKALQRLYNKNPNRILRSEEDWQKYLALKGCQLRLALDSNQSPQGYIAVGKGRDFPEIIHDWAGDPKWVFSLVLDSMDKEGAKGLLAPHEADPVAHMLQELGAFVDVGVSGYWRPLNLASLSEKLGVGLIADCDGKESSQMRVLSEMIFGTTDSADEILGMGLLKGKTDWSDEDLESVRQNLPLPIWIWGFDSH